MMRGLQSSFPKIASVGHDVYEINVMDISGFVDYLESLGINVEDATRYAAEGSLITLALESRDDMVIFIYNKGENHGVLELYGIAQPENLDDVVGRFVHEVDGERNVRG